MVLVGRVARFVDVCGSDDPYPEAVWRAAGMYFQALDGEEAVLPGGRYACAQALAVRGLPFLKGFSLGQACHFVQMSISQRRLLGYRDGQLVSFLRSDECMKEMCAFAQLPTVEPNLRIASLEEARHGLWNILHRGPPQPGITLSNVKRYFQAHYGMALNETALGHPRLHSLLQAPCFHDICYVEAGHDGLYMVRPVRRASRYVPAQSVVQVGRVGRGRGPESS